MQMSKHKFFYEGSLSRKINLSQGAGQGRILAPFMYKVYVNGLLNVLSNHCYAIFINGSRIPSPLFADDISLLTLHPSGGVISITLKVASLRFLRLSYNILSP